jgi:hypothetical protein
MHRMKTVVDHETVGQRAKASTLNRSEMFTRQGHLPEVTERIVTERMTSSDSFQTLSTGHGASRTTA